MFTLDIHGIVFIAGNGLRRGFGMIDYYGRDFVDQMEADKRKEVKIYKKDYEEMLKDFNQQIKYHLNRIKGAA